MRQTVVHMSVVAVLAAAGNAIAQTDAENRALIDEIIDAAGTFVAPAGDCPPQVPGEPSSIGQWVQLDQNTNTGVIHGAVLPTGKVVWWSGDLVGPLISGLWDPATNQMTTQSMLGSDVFCGHHVYLADGTLLTVGGGGGGPPGITNALTFDNDLEEWKQMDKMQFGRWYPTAVTLGDGKVVVFSGDFGPVEEVEIYDPEIDDWSILPPSADKHLEIYPSFHLLPDGKLFYTGTRWNGGAGWGGATTALLDMESYTWSNVGNHVIGDRAEAMSVLLPEKEPGAEPWRVLVAGGYANGSQQDSAEIIDMSQEAPTWQAIGDMVKPRNNANGVILPDGNVLFCTGIEGFKWNGNRVDSLEAEIFDPTDNSWTEMDAMQHPGQYHSISLLLPDGRVVKTGGQDGGPVVYEIEIYSPPYLFQGDRPVITDAPEDFGVGGTFEIDTPEADDIQMVSLVRMSSITHHTNSDQRFLSLEFSQLDGDTLKVSAPDHNNLAPPGPYYLTIINSCGVPSVSEVVLVNAGNGCYADIDGDGDLTILDFVAYQNAFTAGDPIADCDGDGDLTILDFVCFQNQFTLGCSWL